jgi:mycothiol synthase
MTGELLVREATEADARAIADLLNDYSSAIFGEADLDEDEIRHWFTLPNLWFRVADRDGRLVGYADLQDEQGHGTRFDLDLRTADAEAALVLIEVAEREAHARAGPDARLRGFAPADDEALAAVYERCGFRVVRHSFQMRIELDGGPASPDWPDGVTVRPFRPGEERRVFEANEEAFQDHWDYRPTPFDEWRRWAIEHPKFDPSLWFLAEEGDEIAGVSLCTWHYSGDPEFAWVNALSVRRPWRRRGLGLALLLHSFAELAGRGATRVGLGVDGENTTGAVRLYERAGMAVARRTDAYEKTL